MRRDMAGQFDITGIEALVIVAVVMVIAVLLYVSVFGESNQAMCARLCHENHAQDFGTCVTVCVVAAEGRDAATAGGIAAGIAAGAAASGPK